jgi:predicted dehydrogenase
MNKLKIGVIGAGVLGAHHIGKCLKNPDVALAGFYDSDVSRRSTIMKKYSVPAFDDEASLLSESDAVIIATPGSTHREIARRCLAAGKHVLVEKPLAASYEEGVDLVQRAKEAAVVLHVGHSEAFNASFEKLLMFHPVPRFIEVHRLAAFSPRGTDVSVILDLMVHDLQLILRLCKEEPVYGAIAATGVPVVSNGIDIASVRLPFPSGCVANLTASRISSKRMRKIRVFEKDNYYSVDLDEGVIDHYYLPSVQRGLPELPVAFKKNTMPPRDALESEHRAFVDAVSGVPCAHAVSGEEALIVLKVCDVILKLIASGETL